MKKNVTLLTIIISVQLFSSCAIIRQPVHTVYAHNSRLKPELNQLFDDPEFGNAILGVSVQSLHSGEYLYLKNENTNLIPASNLKLFTTATALTRLSPEYRFQTNIYYKGSISDDGILNGDIIIRGSGDPSINGRYHDNRITYVLDSWADSLFKKGIRAITGYVIGDDNYFDDEIMGEGWAWDYQSDWYAAQISALSFNDNCIDIIISPGDTIGAPVNISIEPDVDYIEIVNSAITVHGKPNQVLSASRDRGTNRIHIRGAFPVDAKEKRLWVSVENPTLFTASAFRQSLEQRGIEISGPGLDIDDFVDYNYTPSQDYILAEYISPPLSDIVTTVNKVSQNLYSELLLRTLGAKFKNRGSAEAGIEIVKSFITSIGINPLKFNMSDGSGLSRLNLITAKQITTLLRYMKSSPVADVFFNSLPVAGVNGSLKHRMLNSNANGKVAAKTGYLGNVVSLSGYITTENDELVFSMIINNYTVPTSMAHSLQDLICERLVHYSSE
ncbi:MAG: D-alanyl-D-alanine carboxypeptidase/D-alanyl-D-alanine-endopeptidase [candidate division KSB1 bacterium]|jgi:D-alanyl-D-alanine carboxypeptidase/D-alanyl-D-alanine-endopeptidase (penicillin-binding protein 4)|nr:D-alanyl-D-alanine carboxypeptidase/D-alanyl-D-alanine-endopeptidase [candidate division KSB1 bacterium]